MQSIVRSMTTTRRLGADGPEVSAIGLGCMGMSEFYGPSDRQQSLATFDRALEVGINFWDTAEIYGQGRNEQLVGEALKGRRDQVVVATKFGIDRREDGEFAGLDSSPERLRRACEASLKRLGTDRIDVWYQHRVDPGTPIEDTVGAMARLVEEGKVRYLGLCETSTDTLRRAAAVHPIAALQSEYSLWTRDVEAEVLVACRELGTALVPYSPLGRGVLSGHIRSIDDLADDDWRRTNPRFEEQNFAKNLELADHVRELAEQKSCTPAQLALAWLLAQGDDIVPIPGTRRSERVAENAGASDVELSAAELANIEARFPLGVASGGRYPESMMSLVNA